MNRIYLDHAATTAAPVRVAEAMKPWLTYEYGNPSSLYEEGRRARDAVEHAREIVANTIGAKPNQIFFTSGGSESDNWALKSAASKNKFTGHIITSPIEHPAVLRTCEYLAQLGMHIDYLPVTSDGFVKAKDLRWMLRNDTVLVSVMMANNEIGSIQPIHELADVCQSANVPFHTDAVQAVGAIPVNVGDLNVDYLSISAHKFNGPKGVGALYARDPSQLVPLIHGGHQETGLRAGTENVAGIVGMCAAMEAIPAWYMVRAENRRIAELTQRLVEGIMRIPDVYFIGPETNRLPNNASFRVKGINSDLLTLRLDLEGVCVSTGSACSSGDQQSSHVLRAIGISDDEAKEVVRMTTGKDLTAEDIDRAVQIIRHVIFDIRKNT